MNTSSRLDGGNPGMMMENHSNVATVYICGCNIL